MEASRHHQSFRSSRTSRPKLLLGGIALILTAGAGVATAAHEPPRFTDPEPGAFVSTSTVMVRGTAAGDAVSVRIFEGASILADTGLTNGYFSAEIPLSDGTHTLRARARDADGTFSALSDPLSFTVDTVAPASPAITSPASGQIVTFPDVTIEGTAEPSARVRLELDTAAPREIPVDHLGAWATTMRLGDAEHTATAITIDDAGNQSLPSAPRTFRVDTRPPTAPIIFTPGDGSFWNSTAVHITGTAEPGSTVQVFEGITIVLTTAATDGTWSGTPTFTAGPHAITARATDAAGHPSAFSPQVRFTVDLIDPPAPTILEPIEDGFVPHAYVVTGTAEPHATVELVGNSHVLARAPADASGAWRIERRSYSGLQQLRARAVDRAGNVGPLSPPRTFTVDSTAPLRPKITTPDDTIFLPTDVPRIEGEAFDDLGVLAIRLEYYDLTGKAIAVQNANCYLCPDTEVEWHTTWHPPPLMQYVVKVYAIDQAGNSSLPAKIRITRL